MSRTHTPEARINLDAAPVVVVVFLSLLFALSVWAAFAPPPMPDVATAAVQGGL